MIPRVPWKVVTLLFWTCIAAAMAQTTVEEGYIPVADGVELYYVKYGAGIPDLIVSSQIYTSVPLSGLADGRTVVFYDTRGRGFSTPVRDGSMLGAEQEISDYGRVQDHFGADTVAIMGWSLWGNFAQVYAARNPGRVSSVVAFGPAAPALQPYASMAPLSPGPDIAELNRYMQAVPEGADPWEVCLGTKDILMPSQVADTSVLPSLNQKLCALANERDDNIGFTLGEIFGSMGEWNWLEEFAMIDVPVLVIHGDQDTVVPEGIDANVEAISDAQVAIVANAGHMGFIERPGEYVRLVGEFLDSRP